MSKQTTIANKISCSGVGLHSGRTVAMSIIPAAVNTGILFKRMDLSGKQAYIPARYDHVYDTRLGTTIGNAYGVSVATIEHLMAALWGAGVDNAVVEIDGPEIPIMDGSSEPFMSMLECAGIREFSVPRLWLKIVRAIEVRDGDSCARISPNTEGEEGCILDIEIEFPGTLIAHQMAQYDFRDVSFKKALSRARTFGFEHEVAALRKSGLALGGSLENAVVIGKHGVINKEGLRYDDEFLRHKALDCLGDLYLAGCRIDGHCSFVRPGHAINNALLRAVFADETAYKLSVSGQVVESVVPSARGGVAVVYA